MYNPEYGTDAYSTETYETEEERRRRLALEQEQNTPVKQTITTDPVTGAQTVKIEGSAYNLSSANPATPTVSGPVSPNDTYQRMIQAESGGRQFNPQGGVLTSPKGALGAGQVMPATAMQPGYGVTNIFDMAQQRGMPVAQRDEATAKQLLGNEQLNREFGQNYFNAMQQRFPQDPNAAVAAYNAGPGRVGQNMQANAGQLNTAQLPDETQAYIQKVMGRMPTQAQAQPQPIINDQGQVIGQETPEQMIAGAKTNAPVAQGPVAPGAQSNMIQTQTGTQPAMNQQMGPPTSAMSQQGWIDRFNSAKGDIGTMSSMLADPNLPKGAQMEIAASMADQMRFQKMELEKREQYTRGIETGNFRQMERDDRKSGGEGSWLRYFMYGLMGSPNAAIEKQRLMPELYAKPDYVTMPDGQTQAVIMRDDNGNAIRGTTADGRSLSQKELIEASNLSATPKYKPEVSLQNVEKGDQKGRVVTIYDKKGNPKTVVESGGKQYNYDSSWKPESISTATEKALAQKQINLAYDPVIEAAKKGAGYLAEVNAKYGTNFKIQGQENGQPVLVDGNTGQRVAGAAGGQITATTTPAQLEANQRGAEKKSEIIGKTEGETVASDIKNQRFADSTYSLIAPIAEQIKKSTGSGVGSAVDSLASIIGKSTDGAKAISQLKTLSYPILANVPRFEGPQSDYDVQIYKSAAGDFANDKLPVETRLAALQGMISLLKKYDKEGKNDWTFGGNAPGAAAPGAAAPGVKGGSGTKEDPYKL